MCFKDYDNVDGKICVIIAISAFVLLILAIIGIFINNHIAGKRKGISHNTIIFNLMIGKEQPAKIKRKYKEEKEDEILYFIVFRYVSNTGITNETTQRVKKETYQSVFEGDDITVVSGIIDEYPDKNELMKKVKSRRISYALKNRMKKKNTNKNNDYKNID